MRNDALLQVTAVDSYGSWLLQLWFLHCICIQRGLFLKVLQRVKTTTSILHACYGVVLAQEHLDWLFILAVEEVLSALRKMRKPMLVFDDRQLDPSEVLPT